MPGSTANLFNFVAADLAVGYTPALRDVVAVAANRIVLAHFSSENTARVVGVIISLNASGGGGIIAGVGSSLPLKMLGTLAEFTALSTQAGYLTTSGNWGDAPTDGQYIRQLFTLPKPIALLQTADLESVYVTLEPGFPLPQGSFDNGLAKSKRAAPSPAAKAEAGADAKVPSDQPTAPNAARNKRKTHKKPADPASAG